ncbi:MAG: TetR/AcrR family transcriptional regulator [Bacillota bacterium]
MPKAFSDTDKKEIREKILKAGRDLFSRFGLKKTGIKDITKAVGISQGSFYTFYDSKEELYFAILEKEEEKIQVEILESNFLEDDITARDFENFLLKGFHLIDNNKLLKRLYQDKSEYQQMVRKLPAEKIESHIKNDEEKLMPIITRLQQEGKIVAKDPALISSLLRSIFLLSLHKAEIGEDIYQDTMELMIKLLSQGLFTE